jgi:acyl-coenzyme A thioesterase PaaI-like protein
MDRRKAMLTTAPRAYGVADPAEARLMTGREFLEAILDGQLPAPPIAKTLSFWLTEIGDGVAVFEGDAGPHLLNPLGIVHGGWALTLIDSAAGCAAHTLLPAGASAMRQSRPRPISLGQSPRTRAASAPRGARSAAGGASSPARRGSSTPRATFLHMGPRR